MSGLSRNFSDFAAISGRAGEKFFPTRKFDEEGNDREFMPPPPPLPHAGRRRLISRGPRVFRSAFRLRLSNGATNHPFSPIPLSPPYNDPKAGRTAIIATRVLPASLPFSSRFVSFDKKEKIDRVIIFSVHARINIGSSKFK